MLGGREDWLPARAEPINVDASFGGDSTATDEEISAMLRVRWRVHVEGREPYEFSETIWNAPAWTVRGARRGKRWYRPRLHPTGGLLAELGVPCQVHPDKPEKLSIDWDAAYDEHKPVWDRKDAVSKRYSQRAEGPLGKLLAPVEFVGLRKFSPEEQEEIDREVEERIAREQRLPPQQQAEVDENEWVAAQGVEARRLFKEGRRASATISTLEPPAPGSVVYGIRLDVEGVGIVDHRQALNDKWAASLQPGSQTEVMLDPADPRRLTLA